MDLTLDQLSTALKTSDGLAPIGQEPTPATERTSFASPPEPVRRGQEKQQYKQQNLLELMQSKQSKMLGQQLGLERPTIQNQFQFQHLQLSQHLCLSERRRGIF